MSDLVEIRICSRSSSLLQVSIKDHKKDRIKKKKREKMETPFPPLKTYRGYLLNHSSDPICLNLMKPLRRPNDSSENVKEAAYKGMVRPILEYGSSVWDPHPDKLQEELEKGSKSCGKVCD